MSSREWDKKDYGIDPQDHCAFALCRLTPSQNGLAASCFRERQADLTVCTCIVPRKGRVVVVVAAVTQAFVPS